MSANYKKRRAHTLAQKEAKQKEELQESDQLAELFQQLPTALSGFIVEPYLSEEKKLLEHLTDPVDECPTTILAESRGPFAEIRREIWFPQARPHVEIDAFTFRKEHDWCVSNFDQWLFQLLDDLPVSAISILELRGSKDIWLRTCEATSQVYCIEFLYSENNLDSFQIYPNLYPGRYILSYIGRNGKRVEVNTTNRTEAMRHWQKFKRILPINLRISTVAKLIRIIDGPDLGCDFKILRYYPGEIFARFYNASGDWTWRFPFTSSWYKMHYTVPFSSHTQDISFPVEITLVNGRKFICERDARIILSFDIYNGAQAFKPYSSSSE